MGKENSVLLLFTGGTISMSEDPATGALRPIDFARLQEYMPELKQTGVHIKSIPFLPLIDSSDIQPDTWVKLALTIQEHYDEFDGFVVLHGTDTMAHTASALSFMLENLSKPVIFTGAHLNARNLVKSCYFHRCPIANRHDAFRCERKFAHFDRNCFCQGKRAAHRPRSMHIF